MTLSDFFRYDHQKLIIPAILILLFAVVLILDSPQPISLADSVNYVLGDIINLMKYAYLSFVNFLRPSEMKQITTFDTVFFGVMLVLCGYLVSCAARYLYRHNTALYYRGKKIYLLVFAVGFLVFLYAARSYSADPRVTLLASLITGYLATTIVWDVYDLLRIRKLLKKIRRQKSLAKYFRWEFRYLK